MGTPKKLADGRFYANIGYTTVGSRSQPKFLLGRNPAQAITRAALIDQLWEHSVDVARDMMQVVDVKTHTLLAADRTRFVTRTPDEGLADLANGALSGYITVVVNAIAKGRGGVTAVAQAHKSTLG